MREPKTRPTGASVEAFIDAVQDARQREDSRALCALMREITGAEPVMWGPTIIGFGSCTYQTRSGCGGNMPITGFSPRKGNLVLYIATGFDGFEALLQRLGRPKCGVSCLYLKRLADVDAGALRELVARSVAVTRARHP